MSCRNPRSINLSSCPKAIPHRTFSEFSLLLINSCQNKVKKLRTRSRLPEDWKNSFFLSRARSEVFAFCFPLLPRSNVSQRKADVWSSRPCSNAHRCSAAFNLLASFGFARRLFSFVKENILGQD